MYKAWKKIDEYVIAPLLNAFRNKTRGIVTKFFYKKSYDYYATIRKVSQGLATIFDFDEIYRFVGDIILSTLKLRNIYILSAVHNGGYEVAYKKFVNDENKKKEAISGYDKGKIKIGRRSDIVRFLKTSDDIIIRNELTGFERNLDHERIRRIKSKLESFQCAVVVPVFADKKLELLLVLGDKLSGDRFTKEDINLLNTISDQTAIAIKNAGLYKEKVHTERLASIGMMAATFAHEIRNPLTSLKTFAQLMPEKYNDAEFRDTFSQIVIGEIEKINGLIEGLLDFSSMKKSPGINNFNITDLINETVDYVKAKLEFEKREIMFEKNYGNDEIKMSGDAERLKDAFVNIINNGCQAMNAGGVLKVDMNPNGRNVDIMITDTGEGIPQEDIDKIFDPFVTTKEMGVGLGLAISRKIIEDHSGGIKVKSKLLKGTTFTISLPKQN